MTVNVLGTEYAVTVKKYDEDEAFARRSIIGYCDEIEKRIIICDMLSCPGWEKETAERAKTSQKQTLRHEIVHAFFNESGLTHSAVTYEGPWPRNEEMVDWIAWQGPKIYEAWQKAGAM